MQRFSPKASSVLEKKIFKGFYHIWAWRPSWSMDRNHFSNFSFPQPKEAPYEIWVKLAQRLQRRSRLKMLTDGRTEGRKVITIAHAEHSSGELKTSVEDRHTDRRGWVGITNILTIFSKVQGFYFLLSHNHLCNFQAYVYHKQSYCRV